MLGIFFVSVCLLNNKYSEKTSDNKPCKVISIRISTSGSRSTAIIPIAGIRLAIPIVGIRIHNQICKTFSATNGVNL